MTARFIALLFAFSFGLLACEARKAPLTGAPCPCPLGYVCCAEANLCFPEGEESLCPSRCPCEGPEETCCDAVGLCFEQAVATSCAQPCPCQPGLVCCEAAGVCVPEAAAAACATMESLSLISIAPAQGPAAGGDRVMIEGTRLSSTLSELSISIGGRACDALSHPQPSNLNRVECTAPPAAPGETVVDVVLTSSESVALLKDGFRYIQSPFTELPLLPITQASNNSVGLTVLDANRDGHWDLFFADLNGGDDELYLGQGDLRFMPVVDVGAFELPRTHSAVAADFNRDGWPDLMLAVRVGAIAKGWPMLLHLQGNGDGSFSIRPQTEFEERLVLKGLRVVDLEGDGDLDLIGCQAALNGMAPPALAIFTSESGDFTRTSSIPFATTSLVNQDCEESALGDFDNDGDPDLALCSGDSLGLFENQGGVFTETSASRGLGATLPAACRGLQWVDVDGDGRLELSVFLKKGAPERSGVLVYRFAQNTFSLMPPVDETSAIECLWALTPHPGAAFGAGVLTGLWNDLDQDGSLDLLVPHPSGICLGVPVLYQGEASSAPLSFSPVEVPITGIITSPTGIASVDLDRDGDLDVLINDQGSLRRRFIRNNLIENDPATTSWGLSIYALTDEDGDATDQDRFADHHAWGVTILLDIDGPSPQPDFAPGPGLRASVLTTSARSSQGPPRVHFGLGAHPGPVWARTTFPDGSQITRRIERSEREVQLRDCANASCP